MYCFHLEFLKIYCLSRDSMQQSFLLDVRPGDGANNFQCNQLFLALLLHHRFLSSLLSCLFKFLSPIIATCHTNFTALCTLVIDWGIFSCSLKFGSCAVLEILLSYRVKRHWGRVSKCCWILGLNILHKKMAIRDAKLSYRNNNYIKKKIKHL